MRFNHILCFVIALFICYFISINLLHFPSQYLPIYLQLISSMTLKWDFLIIIVTKAKYKMFENCRKLGRKGKTHSTV